VDTVLLSAQDFDFGEFQEIPFSSPQTLFDYDLVLWDLRWLCFNYHFDTLEKYSGWAEPKQVVFREGLKRKIILDRERRIKEVEHLLCSGEH
jgi:hypothetical protein